MSKQANEIRVGAGLAIALVFAGCTSGSSSTDGAAGTAAGKGGQTASRGGSQGTGGGSGGAASGGAVSSGGTSAVGGAPGGAGGSGGATNTGGASAAGGASAMGGAMAAGGTPGTGGAQASGGAGTTGGASGGAGSTAAGGTVGRGGSSAGGGSASGGTPGSGGNAAGGSTAGGGASGADGGNGAGYHQLPGWASSDESDPDQHGRAFFISNGQKDDKGVACTTCHGTNLEGASGPSCASCHSTWRSTCTFCHGTSPSQLNPPRGIYDESTTATLAVGRHVAHLSAGASHAAFACTTCHVVPGANDVSHTLPYQHAADLSTAGHQGEVTFSGQGLIWSGTTWTVGATTGSPVSARGTCAGGCHSDGRGGAPAKTPYWAGGAWTTGCNNCHAATPSTGHHGHALSNGATCADCHGDATSTTYASTNHMNGTRDHLGTVAGQSMTLTNSGSSVRCSGACHGNSNGHNGNW